MGAAGRGAGACVRSALRSGSLGSPDRTRVFPLPSRAAPSRGLPCALCCHFLSGRTSTFELCPQCQGKISLSRSMAELSWAFTLEAPRQGSGCLEEGSIRAGGPAASSIRDTPKGRRDFRVLLDQRSGWGSSCHSDPHAWTARAVKLIQIPPRHAMSAAPERPL